MTGLGWGLAKEIFFVVNDAIGVVLYGEALSVVEA
jgi:hypothetical protein